MQTRALTHSRLIKHNIKRLDSVLPSINQANSHEIRLYRMEPNNADQKSATSKPFSIQAANWKSSALITKIKRPSVIIVRQGEQHEQWPDQRIDQAKHNRCNQGRAKAADLDG